VSIRVICGIRVQKLLFFRWLENKGFQLILD